MKGAQKGLYSIQSLRRRRSGSAWRSWVNAASPACSHRDVDARIPLRAILWGLGRAFTPNPSTFTFQRRKALRDAFIRSNASGCCGHGEGGRLTRARAMAAMAAVFRCREVIPPAQATMCAAGWPVEHGGQIVCWCLCFGGIPTLSLWITQVRGYKFCDGIVKGLRAEARM